MAMLTSLDDVPSGRPGVRGALEGFRPWHPLVQRHTHFEWLTGLRVALAFVLPAAVGAAGGRDASAWSMIAFGGFLAAIVASQVPATRELAISAPAIVAAVPVAVALGMLAAGWMHVALVALAGLAVGIAASGPPRVRRAASAVGVAVVLAPELPSSAAAMVWPFVGAVWAIALVLATQPLRAWARPSTAPRPAPVSRTIAIHHGVRLAVGLTIAGAIAELLGDATPMRAHAMWIALGVWIVLQPHLHDALVRGIQRAGGTVLGGALSLALVHVWPPSVWTGWLVLGCAFVCFGLRAANYAWYCVALTPVVTLGIGHLPTDLAVLEARVGWTVVGTLIALALRFTLWPLASTEPARRPGSGPIEGVGEIGDEVGGGLDADRQAHEVRRDLQR